MVGMRCSAVEAWAGPSSLEHWRDPSPAAWPGLSARPGPLQASALLGIKLRADWLLMLTGGRGESKGTREAAVPGRCADLPRMLQQQP